MGLDIQHDREAQRFFTTVNGDQGYLQYAPVSPGKVDFQSTFVPPSLRGQGVAAAIVEHALEWAEEHEYQVIPSCWYVAQFLDRHPRFQGLRAER